MTTNQKNKNSFEKNQKNFPHWDAVCVPFLSDWCFLHAELCVAHHLIQFTIVAKLPLFVYDNEL